MPNAYRTIYQCMKVTVNSYVFSRRFAMSNSAYCIITCLASSIAPELEFFARYAVRDCTNVSYKMGRKYSTNIFVTA